MLKRLKTLLGVVFNYVLALANVTFAIRARQVTSKWLLVMGWDEPFWSVPKVRPGWFPEGSLFQFVL